MSIAVTFHDEAHFKSAIQSVRDDKSSTNWVVVEHHNDDPNILCLAGKGDDGFNGLKGLLNSSKVQYCLLRITSQVDMSTTVKFVYIYNLGQDVKFTLKGKFGVVKGQAKKYFEPFHVELDIERPSEISAFDIERKIKEAAGTANHVRDAGFVENRQERGYTSRSQPTTLASAKSLEKIKTSSNSNLTAISNNSPSAAKSSPSSHVPVKAQHVQIGEDLLAAIKSVRDDKNETKWVVGSYSEGDINKPVVLVASGATSVEDLKQHFKSDSLSYAITRVVDVIDGHPTTKFVFIQWIGNDALSEAFSPFHVDFTISEKREISDSIILNKVQSYSGSKSFVK